MKCVYQLIEMMMASFADEGIKPPEALQLSQGAYERLCREMGNLMVVDDEVKIMPAAQLHTPLGKIFVIGSKS
jgi:hypothetical protein